MQFSVMTSSDGTTFILLASSGVVPYTNFTSAAPWGVSPSWRKFPLPAGVRRFVRLDWSVTNGPLTAGKVLAGLSSEMDYGDITAFPRAYVG